MAGMAGELCDYFSSSLQWCVCSCFVLLCFVFFPPLVLKWQWCENLRCTWQSIKGGAWLPGVWQAVTRSCRNSSELFDGRPPSKSAAPFLVATTSFLQACVPARFFEANCFWIMLVILFCTAVLGSNRTQLLVYVRYCFNVYLVCLQWNSSVCIIFLFS